VELVETDLKIFNSERVARGAIHAKVRLADRSLNVFCTHLTADAGELRRKKPGSWRAEQSAQIDALLDWISQKAHSQEPVIIMGDLNCGPDLGGRIEARLPQHYARFERVGFSNPFAGVPRASCTWCFDNPLVDFASTGGRLIDHILLRGFPNDAKAERIFDQPVALTIGAQRIASAYSDHYGVMVALQGVASD
jgi:endonuclease/exonuclease/phosphatase family metal-dependent hydrolase